MTLREAIEKAELAYKECIEHEWHDNTVEAFRLVIDAAKLQADDTVEIVTLTEGGK